MFLPKITLSFSCLLFVFTAQSQTLRDSLELRRDLDTYHRISRRLDIDSILAFMPPKMFEVAPKNMVKEALQNTFENDDFTMGFDSFSYGKVLPLVKIGNQVCTMVNYDMRLFLIFSNDQDSAFINLMTDVFVEQFGADNVRIDPKNNARLNVKEPGKKMFALKEPEWDSWKFLEDERGDGDGGNQQLLNVVVPKEVLDYFK